MVATKSHVAVEYLENLEEQILNYISIYLKLTFIEFI